MWKHLESEKVEEETLSTAAKTPKNCSEQRQSIRTGEETIDKIGKEEELKSMSNLGGNKIFTLVWLWFSKWSQCVKKKEMAKFYLYIVIRAKSP